MLRTHVLPPVELEDFISPLASFRHLSRDWKDKTIAEVKNYPAGTRMRFATMNAYDGTVFKIDPQLNAQFVQVDSILDKGVSADSKAQVKLVNYDQPWVPLLGDAPVSYTHLTLPTTLHECRSRWSSGGFLRLLGVPPGSPRQW